MDEDWTPCAVCGHDRRAHWHQSDACALIWPIGPINVSCNCPVYVGLPTLIAEEGSVG